MVNFPSIVVSLVPMAKRRRHAARFAVWVRHGCERLTASAPGGNGSGRRRGWDLADGEAERMQGFGDPAGRADVSRSIRGGARVSGQGTRCSSMVQLSAGRRGPEWWGREFFPDGGAERSRLPYGPFPFGQGIDASFGELNANSRKLNKSRLSNLRCLP